MSAEKRFYIIGFYISLGLYIAIFIALAHMYGNAPDILQRFTAKENFLDIMLVERKQESGEDKTSTVTVIKQDSSPAAIQTQTMGVQDLFANIDETNLTKIGAKASTPSRLDGKENQPNNASKLLDKLTFKKQSTLTVTSANSGIYDPFIGKIQDMLSEKWSETVYTVSGTYAQVEITINNRGDFSYSIVSLSYNSNFNEKLKNFLDEMKSEVFPPYEGDGVFKFNTTFKDEME
ncbi:MAG: TonB C-terminal domain-containing protein [Campylobacteraceae bacterium]|jgi:protein TonB|nr:TonB C-terminal domain-containing protein [Campylobacteraceae bacterium]